MKYSILFFMFLAINLHAQPEEIHKKDTLKAAAVKMFRSLFWSNIPERFRWTNDYENLFTDIEEAKLDSIVERFERETSMEIAIVTIDTIKASKEKFDDLSLHIAQRWGVGKKGKDNGVLIAISKGYRRIRIQNGNGIEKMITDEETKSIIDHYIIPEFKKEDYYYGTRNGLLEMIKLLKSKNRK